MAKVYIEYDLNDSEDVDNLNLHLKSSQMYCVIFEIANNLKKECVQMCEKDEGISAIEAVYNTFEKIHDILDYHKSHPDDLM